MTPLSPAAQAVLDAYYTHADLLNREVSHEEMLAAALCAAVDQVVPHEDSDPMDDELSLQRRCQRQRTRRQLLAIASELEGR
jgi:hypothetical protein